MTVTDILRPIVLMQPFLTLVLVALLWIYYTRLGKQQILRWWAYAWIADGTYLAAEWTWVELGSPWTLPHGGLVVVTVVAGLVQAPLLVLGAASLEQGASPGPRARRSLIGLALGAAVVVLFLCFRAQQGDIRLIARATLCGTAFLYCAVIFRRQWRRLGSGGAAVTGLASAVYGMFFLTYAVFVVLAQHKGIQVVIGLTFTKAVCQVGVTLGLVLLLLETAEAAEQRVRAVVQGLKAIVWESDPTRTQLSFISQPVEEILGYPVERWLKEPGFWLSIVHPDDREQAVTLRRKAIAEGKDPELEYRAIAADGRVVWLRDTVRAVRDSGGRVRGLRGVLVDIRERKRAEEEQRKLIALVENSTDSIALALPEGPVLYLNPAGLRLVGLDSLEQARNRTILDLLSEEGSLRMREEGLPAALRTGHWEGELHYRHCKSGATIPAVLTAFPIRTPQTGEPIALACVGRDITERKQMEEQLRQAQRMEAIGQLAGGVAHDFNNLLTAILGYAELVLDELRSGDPLLASVLEIKKAGERAASLTQQLLAFSRRQILQPKLICLNDVVAEVDQMLRRLIGEHIDMTIVREPALGAVKADPGQIHQVILNLAINARDAMADGGKLTIETANMDLDAESAHRHYGVPPGRYVTLAVRDTGHGMDQEMQSRVFEPFFTTKGRGRGTGLGLSTVYGIVRQSGGHVRVESEPGKGAAFQVYLPRREEPVEAAQAHSVPGPARGSETILLVEDEAGVRRLIRAVLERHGYTVLEAPDGMEALRISAGHSGPVDVLVTDVVMPQISGSELADRLAAFYPNMKVLFMSGYADDEIVRKGVSEDGRIFLQKPFTPEAVTSRIRDLLDANAGVGNPANGRQGNLLA